ncbi:MAG: type I restriction enzyme HsdR N-terminal domain-containing protein [Endomicrobium sp.]|jgi:DNA modification methylase|nr:type I restriction enzyme HsdR N-terminal domain-containing protein [Endomicrobium sp.]
MNNYVIPQFNDLNFKKLFGNPDFKEDSVREVVISPLLEALGYRQENIVRSKAVKFKAGSQKKEITLIPDYILEINGKYACVLDAKSPKENILSNDNVAQVYSYATNPEIRSAYFALCNGKEFSLFKTSISEKPILFFNTENINENFDKLRFYISPNSFHNGKDFVYEPSAKYEINFDYTNRPLLEEIQVKKQAAKRHFGVHGYFTKQAWNVVAEYIKNFSQKGDLVLDPFGGSGVTAIEALMNERKAINVDLNPMAVFLVNSLAAPVKQSELAKVFEEVKSEYTKKEPKTKKEILQVLQKYRGLKKLTLPKGSDVDTVDKLFSQEQTAKLALLKSIILKQKDDNLRNTLLLMFSGVITRVNLTYHISTAVESQTGFGGDASAMRYYRYRIAPNPTAVDILQAFELRYKKISQAKKEMEYFINDKTISNVKIVKGTATDLSFIKNESVDYIYTDPPYGKKIPYLDLSVMWNAWLDLDVSEKDYQLEAIEGGQHHKTKDDYNDLIAQSIKEMYRVLKYDRWLSFVFAHKDPEFWHLIIDTAEACGFEYVGAVSQKNGQTSFKKRQNPFTVLSGQLIINFKKIKNPKFIMKAHLGMKISDIVMQTIEGIIAKNNGATVEEINDELIIKGLELGFLDLLKKEYSDLTPLLIENFDYDKKSEIYTIKENKKFTTHLDVRLRIKYYLISYLRRIQRENKTATFDEIILNILPLLKNGSTPENQTILNVLQDIAYKSGKDCWTLRKNPQLMLDGFI